MLTFKLATRSAVSSRVNWDIWSTIVEILGFEACAASVLWHLLCLVCDCCEVMRRHCDDREYGCRAMRWHARVIDRVGVDADIVMMS